MDEWHPYNDLCENVTSHTAIHLFVTASQFAVLGDSCCEYQLHGTRGGDRVGEVLNHKLLYLRTRVPNLPA